MRSIILRYALGPLWKMLDGKKSLISIIVLLAAVASELAGGFGADSLQEKIELFEHILTNKYGTSEYVQAGLAGLIAGLVHKAVKWGKSVTGAWRKVVEIKQQRKGKV